jgi:SAM-dependent methyltransferase
MGDRSLTADYFEDIYASNSDPWQFETSEYEARKYADTLAKLGEAQFDRALEIGCSIGVLTALLAERCKELVSVDINAMALASAAKRCKDRPNVRFAQMTVPHEMPSGPFDLVMLSEVGYYWSDEDLALARSRIAGYGAGTLVELVHFLPRVREYKRSGDAVHATFRADARYEIVRSSRADRYRIDVLRVR